MNNNLAIIIPVHVFNDTTKEHMDILIKSIKEQRNNEQKPIVLIVYHKSIDKGGVDELIKYVDEEYKISVMENDGNIDYQSQVMRGVNAIDCDFFTVAEFDDELSVSFTHQMERHTKHYQDVDIFLSTMLEVDIEDKPVKITNETVWSQQFVGENGSMGYLNENLLKEYSDFKLSGAIIKKDSFLEIGGYKSNIKLSFMYEFLLRALNNGLTIYSIPKLMYKHIVGREGSLFDDYQKNMSQGERKFWFETAMKEYVFNKDREVSYIEK